MGNGFLKSVRVVLGVATFGAFVFSAATEARFQQSKVSNQIQYKAGEILVKLKNENSLVNTNQLISKSVINSFSEKFDITPIRQSDESLILIHAENGASTEQLLEEANRNQNIEYSEPNYIYRISNIVDGAFDVNTPSDPKFNLDWGLFNNGQVDSDGHAGKVGSDIGATKAWTLQTGSKDIKVAVIDTGVDYNHEELKDNILINTKEVANNGIDDDGNGFIDDVRGWNFNAKSNNPMDDNEHGTHVSGTIGAKANNGVGTAGVNWNVSILPVKFLDADGSGTLADAVEAIKYATKMGVHVMNNSWGGGGYSKTLFNTIKEARDKGILFVAAAGNEYNDNDKNKSYPASYDLENVISVAATDNRDHLATFSNFGVKSVHLAAPGVNVFSTVPMSKGGYDTFSGTSMACPHVVGAAALVWAANPTFDYKQIKARLLNTVDRISGLSNKVSTGGRLNVYNALINKTSKKIKMPKKWKSESIVLESEHPYQNNVKSVVKQWSRKNAKFVRLHFNYVQTEAGFDKVVIKDGNGEIIDEISGEQKNFSSNYAEGENIVVEFLSDASGVGSGFVIDKIEYLD